MAIQYSDISFFKSLPIIQTANVKLTHVRANKESKCQLNLFDFFPP